MGTLNNFVSSPNAGNWSQVVLDDGMIWIGFATNGVTIKRGWGLFGKKLYRERNLDRCAEVGIALEDQITKFDTPPGMTQPLLRAFTQVALESDTIAQFLARIGKT